MNEPTSADLRRRTEEAQRISYGKAPPWLPKAVKLLIRAGSHAYGLALPTSDIDLRGVCIAPKDAYLGLYPFERFAPEKPDTEILDLRVFMRNAANGDLQALQMLYCYPGDIVHAEGPGVVLRTHRTIFLSQKIVKPMAGYVRGMIAKARNAVEKGTTRDVGKDVMHANRVVRMLREALTDHRLTIRRDYDAEELMAMRLAPQDALLNAWRAEEELRSLPGWVSETSLPEEPDMKVIDKLCVRLIEESF